MDKHFEKAVQRHPKTVRKIKTSREAPVILLANGDAGDNQSIAADLEAQGYRVAYTNDGRDALRFAELMGPNLLLLDIGLEGVDGIQICRTLKSQAGTRQIPIIFLAAPEQSDKLAAGFAAGGVDYVGKPLPMEDLLMRIGLRLKTHGAADQTAPESEQYGRDTRPGKSVAADLAPLTSRGAGQLKPLGSEEFFIDEKSILSELRIYQNHLEKQNEALREARVMVEASLERYAELFDFAPIAYFTLGRDGVIEQTNFRGASLLNSECSDLTGQVFINFVSQADQPVFKNFLHNVFVAKDKKACEVCLQFKESQRWVSMEATTADTSRRTCLIAMSDISERKSVEAEKQRLLDVLEISADFIGCADLRGNLFYHNPAALRMVGLPEKADLSGMTIADMHPPWVMDMLGDTVIPQVLKAGVWRGDSALLHRDGREIPVSQLLMLHRDSEGRPEFTSTIVHDITERKWVEDVLTFIAQRGWVEGGQSFLSALADYLCRKLGVDYVVIDKISPVMAEAETVAVSARNRRLPSRRYKLGGTPAEVLLEKSISFFPKAVHDLFPNFRLWSEMRVESYVALPLWDLEGRVIGAIAVMDGKPLNDAAKTKSLLRLVAPSAAAELARRQSEKALAESWQFMHRVIDTIGDPVFVKDRQHRWVLLNQAFCEFIGYSLETLLGKSDADFLPAGEVEVFRSNDETVFANGAEVVNEEAFTGRDRVTRITITKKTRYVDEHGQIMLVGVIRDITERKRMEGQLTAQAQELRTLIENAPDTIVRYDLETRITYVNPQQLKILKKSAAQLLGSRAEDQLQVRHPSFHGYLSALNRVIHTGMPEEYLLEIDEGLLGRAVYDNIRFAPEFAEDGKMSGVIAIGRNYSRQRQLELELARREQEFRTLAENSPDIIVRYDSECRQIYANRAYRVSFIATAADALGKTPLEFWRLDAPVAREFIGLLQRIMKTGKMEAIEMERLNEENKIDCYATYLVPEFDYNGHVCSVLSISRVITELKASEKRLKESRALLRALTAQREETREDERKRIARELHDELGQRLTALRMDLGRLRLRFGQDNDALKEQVQEMLGSLDGTIAVVRNVAAALRPAVLDMGIVSALEWLADDFGKRTGIRCDLLIPASDVVLDDTYSTAIFRIVQESLTNVARHSQAKKVRVILARQEDDGYLLEIRDDGKGFDSRARRKTDSFGLVGIKERVLMLGGKLTVDTAPGRGVKLSVLVSPGAQAPGR